MDEDSFVPETQEVEVIEVESSPEVEPKTLDDEIIDDFYRKYVATKPCERLTYAGVKCTNFDNCQTLIYLWWVDCINCQGKWCGNCYTMDRTAQPLDEYVCQKCVGIPNK